MASNPGTTRRGFLSGKTARDRASTTATPSAATHDPRPATRDSRPCLIACGRPAMACRFEVLLNPGDRTKLDAASESLDEVALLEDQMTVYRDDSALAALNRRAFDHSVEVEPRLFDLLQRAVRLSQETGGAFDITASPLIRSWGFFYRKGRLPGDEEWAEARGRVGYQHLELDPANRTVRFRRPGMELNLGSIGKGYALDRAAEILQRHGVSDYLCHGGRSSVLVRGNRDGEQGWTVGVRNPLFPQRRLATLRIREVALGTSGIAEQFFRAGGRRWGHVLDPRTGRPAEGLLSVTVATVSAAEADALATAFFVLGVEKTRQYCENHDGVGALVIPQPRRGSRLDVVRLGTLAESDGADPDQRHATLLGIVQ